MRGETALRVVHIFPKTNNLLVVCCGGFWEPVSGQLPDNLGWAFARFSSEEVIVAVFLLFSPVLLAFEVSADLRAGISVCGVRDAYLHLPAMLEGSEVLWSRLQQAGT